MSLETILGSLLLAVGLVVVFIAFPSQIVKNYQEKRFGLSIVLVICGFLVYSLRIPYTIIRQDYYILIPDIVGFVIHIILVYQYFKYKNKTL